MAKSIIREINGVELKGIIVENNVFITKLDTGEYAAFDEKNSLLAQAKTQKEVIEKVNSPKEEKYVEIYVLPPQRTLPRGHVFQAAYVDGVLVASKHTEVSTPLEIHELCTEIIKKCLTLNWKWSLPKIISIIDYKTTTLTFQKNPQAAINHLNSRMNPPDNQGKEDIDSPLT